MKTYKKIVAVLAVLLSALPPTALADIYPGPTPMALADLSATDVMNKILNFLWPAFMGAAVIMLLVAGFGFLISMGNPEKIAVARQSVLWIIVGIVVGVLAFSIPFIIKNTLGF